ncbi:hypothetical protein NQ314_007430 [Rhamnusium bicolor]|uniref:Uncharacterized protein n=1 Tax=Rhamnusium bicolor TaxID=1586634 RepID=A0AAV8YMP9_9CUCU|nr:hypothetical protein NQ314_007430 [Rhamnusium bicolor]
MPEDHPFRREKREYPVKYYELPAIENIQYEEAASGREDSGDSWKRGTFMTSSKNAGYLEFHWMTGCTFMRMAVIPYENTEDGVYSTWRWMKTDYLQRAWRQYEEVRNELSRKLLAKIMTICEDRRSSKSGMSGEPLIEDGGRSHMKSEERRFHRYSGRGMQKLVMWMSNSRNIWRYKDESRNFPRTVVQEELGSGQGSGDDLDVNRPSMGSKVTTADHGRDSNDSDEDGQQKEMVEVGELSTENIRATNRIGNGTSIDNGGNGADSYEDGLSTAGVLSKTTTMDCKADGGESVEVGDLSTVVKQRPWYAREPAANRLRSGSYPRKICGQNWIGNGTSIDNEGNGTKSDEDGLSTAGMVSITTTMDCKGDGGESADVGELSTEDMRATNRIGNGTSIDNGGNGAESDEDVLSTAGVMRKTTTMGCKGDSGVSVEVGELSTVGMRATNWIGNGITNDNGGNASMASKAAIMDC